MKKINNFIINNIEKILLIFLYIQPFLDVLTAISIKKFNFNLTIGSIIRLLYLFFSIYYLLILNTKHKRKNIIYLSLLFIYITLFSVSILIFKDYHALIYEVKNTLNTFYLPITLIALLEMFNEYKIRFELKNLVNIFIIYLLFIIVPTLTKTSFLSYSHSKLGTIGWFLSANAIGNTLSFLLPIVIYYLLKNQKCILFNLILALAIIYIFANIGTKVPILSLLIFLLLNTIYFIIFSIRKKNYKIVTYTFTILILGGLLSFILIPKTSFYKNLEIHRKYLKINNYTEIFTNYNNINNFIFSERLTFLKNTNNSYKNAHNTEKILGIGYIENYNTEKMSTKTIEIDYFEIFYRNGIIGFILYFIIFIKVLILVIKKIFSKFNLLNIQYFISTILILLLALFSGHILITPSVSIYVSLLFAIIINSKNFYKDKI